MIAFVLSSNNYWGKGSTLHQAIKNLKDGGGSWNKFTVVLMIDTPDYNHLWVDDIGQMHTPIGSKVMYDSRESNK